jgi:hypothetical protein
MNGLKRWSATAALVLSAGALGGCYSHAASGAVGGGLLGAGAGALIGHAAGDSGAGALIGAGAGAALGGLLGNALDAEHAHYGAHYGAHYRYAPPPPRRVYVYPPPPPVVIVRPGPPPHARGRSHRVYPYHPYYYDPPRYRKHHR